MNSLYDLGVTSVVVVQLVAMTAITRPTQMATNDQTATAFRTDFRSGRLGWGGAGGGLGSGLTPLPDHEPRSRL
jgi:hypothetical protein